LFPSVTRQEEVKLAIRAQRGDEAARNTLVEAHYGFVVSLAAKHRNCGALMDDMVQNGVIGLMSAINGFDPHRGTRLLTYAYWAIKRGILSAIETSSIFNQPVVCHSLDSTIPEELRRVISLDLMMEHQDSEAPYCLSEAIKDDNVPKPAMVAEDADTVRFIRETMGCLKPRDRKILEMRLGLRSKKMSFQAIGRVLHISGERARRLFDRSLMKVRTKQN
jgi:RNA polymerase primary sigma factor